MWMMKKFHFISTDKNCFTSRNKTWKLIKKQIVDFIYFPLMNSGYEMNPLLSTSIFFNTLSIKNIISSSLRDWMSSSLRSFSPSTPVDLIKQWEISQNHKLMKKMIRINEAKIKFISFLSSSVFWKINISVWIDIQWFQCFIDISHKLFVRICSNFRFRRRIRF